MKSIKQRFNPTIIVLMIVAGLFSGFLIFFWQNSNYSNYFGNKIEVSNPDLKLILSKEEFKRHETVDYVIENISKEPIEYSVAIQRPTEGNKWEYVKRTICPCGAECSMGIPKIMPGEKVELKWNQEESWCEDRSEEIVEAVAPGVYRIEITAHKSSDILYKSWLYSRFIILR